MLETGWTVLSAIRELGTVDHMRGWSSYWAPTLQETHQWDHFSIFFMTIIFLFITCGLKFSMHAFHEAPGVIPVCPIHCLVSEPSFLDLQAPWMCYFAVLPCVKTFCSLTERSVLPCSKQLTWYFYLFIVVHKSRGLVLTFDHISMVRRASGYHLCRLFHCHLFWVPDAGKK